MMAPPPPKLPPLGPFYDLLKEESSSITNPASAASKAKSSIDYAIIGPFDIGHIRRRHARFRASQGSHYLESI